MTGVNSIQNEGQPKVWQSLGLCLAPQDYNVRFWWQLTGYHLAHMVESAGYTIERQYEILLFHYHWIVPRLGPAPSIDGRPKWNSLMAHEGSPLEYSWKWNTSDSKPDIRYSWEAFNPGSSGTNDPLNHVLSLDYMQHVPEILPDVDFTWANHFLAEIEQGSRAASNFLHAVEFHRSQSFLLKSYFLPRNVKLLEGGDSATMEEWNAAIQKLAKNNMSLDSMTNFLTTNPEGKLMIPAVLAMDDVPPSKSRLKLYFTTPHTSIASLREVMTMGGMIDILEADIQDIRSLIETVLGLPKDYPEDANMPLANPVGKTWVDTKDLVECFVYFFDIAPGRDKPDVKFYLPTRRYGPDDLTISLRLMDWMRARGRGSYCQDYLRMMKRVGEHRGLENGKGIHSFISYQVIRGSEPDIKSYFTPETYHPARFPEALVSAV
ncbi:aromatic prenyltransferase [Xylaria venustula]|nr:aromatic prenyltransferase [Xylaria venustula]